ncbi:borealin [Lepisosteus oculatus]|uniref:borealin n=1 Tax=Lepisosteus oculatus TaxID=7918 RepID=UPI00073FD377|nr:PREDICTED: borealin [Lepisosteus oculatus]
MAPKRKTNKSRINKTKMEKMDAFIRDFDNEVKSIVGKLKEKTKSLMKDADNLYNLAIIKLSTAERQINWIEYSAPERKPVEDITKNLGIADVDNIVSEVQMISQKPQAKGSKMKEGNGAKTEDEENRLNNQSSTRKGRKSTKRNPTTSKKNRALSINKQNTSIRKSTRRPLKTPARTIDSSILGPTPLITPKFDSRLPKTPALRGPRHKERVYSISVNGSPIGAGSSDIIISVPSGNGESIQLLASQMDSVDLSQFNEEALKSMRLLQNRLTAVLEK